MENLFEPLRAIQGDVYTVVQDIEKEMATRAKTTAQDYLASRQNILAAGIAAVCTALLLGYALSSSLLWPIGRVQQALYRLAGGGFEGRIAVPNRDELGQLAGHVNETSEMLGELYGKVELQNAQLAEWNRTLETKVADQVKEIERTNRLRRFLRHRRGQPWPGRGAQGRVPSLQGQARWPGNGCAAARDRPGVAEQAADCQADALG